MELALYCPVCGFYEKEADRVGRGGDFYTSVSVGSLFGELLAFQFAAWLEQIKQQAAGAGGAPPGLKIIEAGAHDGRLAEDVLSWLRGRRPELFGELEYCILEPSARRRQWQRRRLGQFAPRVRWCEVVEEIGRSNPQPPIQIPSTTPQTPSPQSEIPIGNRQPATGNSRGINGIIFSNELLDAFPVRRLGWDAAAKTWFEWGVALENDHFAWAKMNRPELPTLNSLPGQSGATTGQPLGGAKQSEDRSTLPTGLLEVLPDGFTIEICPAAENWWRQAASNLRRGKLVTIDYGLAAEEFFAPERSRGTLRAYHRHQVSDDLLARPGEQDLTAHVNFTTIQRAGEKAGLKTEALETQAKFLTRIAEQAWRMPADFGEWTPAHTRQFQTLVHPEHLGRPFRVLIQAGIRSESRT